MGWSSGATGGGGGIDPTRFVPKTRTINGKALDKDVILKLVDISNESGVSLEELINNLNTSTEGLGDLSKQVESNALSIKKIKRRSMSFLDAMPQIMGGGNSDMFAVKIKFSSVLTHVRCIYLKVPIVTEDGWERDIAIKINVVSSGELLQHTAVVEHRGKMIEYRFPLTMPASTKEVIIPFNILNSQVGETLNPSNMNPIGMWGVSE